MKTILLLSVLLLAVFTSGFTQNSQTKTANQFNTYEGIYVNDWKQASAELVANDDNSYAYSKRLSPGHGALFIELQDFRFEIPSGATIDNIAVNVKRFKTGKGSIGDISAYLFSSPLPGNFYGVIWNDPTPYPEVETTFSYEQSGTGTYNGLSYQWTPSLINSPGFMVSIYLNSPVRGTSVVYYDQVTITVEYSLPNTLQSQSVLETNLWKKPVVYPNPFTTTATMQFTAVETGNAQVDLYNVLGVKVRNIFSGKVEKGQVYNATAEGSLLSKGIYIYRIQNGNYNYAGKLIKVD
jgi:type IX secretion system substrate protein